MARMTRAEVLSQSGDLHKLLAPLISTENPDGTPYSLPVDMAKPDAANVLTGRVATTATTAATTIVTVPAGRTWVGTVGASVSCAVTAATATEGRASAVISTAGTGVTPAAGVYLGVDAVAGANAATGTTGNGAANYGSAPLAVVAPAGNAVTIQVATTNTGTVARVDAFASGMLVAQ